ncbi:lytic murein transglycosylase [Verrucosispora sp. TAA-831]|uniref:lytic transglycosylase domain-containing protein n=1 Tax=Verrucosispora sp. TAA-831 TaxID=3422227 RepID=UPI003D6F0449
MRSGEPAGGSPTAGAEPAAGTPTIRAATPEPEPPTEPAAPPIDGKPAATSGAPARNDGEQPGGTDRETAPPPDAATKPDAAAEPDAVTRTGLSATPDARTAPDSATTSDDTTKADDPGKVEESEEADAATKTDGEAAGGTATRPRRARRRRVRFAHAVRMPGPRAAARATRDWARRPGGRLTLPGVFLLALVIATATAGATLVPATVGAPRPVAAGATGEPEATDGTAPLTEAPPVGAVPPTTGTLPPGTTPFPGATGGTAPVGARPSDALAGWAREVGAKTGIDPIAVQAYGYAELVLAETNRACGLSWTTLAAIGFVESRHGQANNARLGPDGRATPEIIGLPLDGQGGRMRIADTDRGELDRDTTYDRAVGPMQFIPTTWQENGADADGDGVKDPHNIHDAALAAGMYLCKGGRNLTVPGDWWNAILSYNNVGRYAQAVFETANRYGQASRT